MAGCANDEIVNSSQLDKVNADGRISFVQKVGNMTRASQQAQTANHYEFGVWAMPTATIASTADIKGFIMKNYLVVYSKDNTYANWQLGGQTYGENASGDLTDAAEGLSSWIYASLGNADDEKPASVSATPYTKSQNAQQVLKYWDQSTTKTEFMAYAPYGSNVTMPTAGDMKFAGVKAFYTSPADKLTDDSHNYQTGITTGKHLATGYSSSEDISASNEELINANEALYARTTVEKAAYGKDVPLNFKHINAKIKLSFYHTIKGYDVELIDLVETKKLGGTKDKIVTAGIALTPATYTMTLGGVQTAKSSLSPYYAQATVGLTGVSESSADVRKNFTSIKVGEGSTSTTENLYFNKPATGTNIGYNSQSNRTLLPTIYYALPNYETSARIDNGTGSSVSENTGYTLHVSFKMKPKDGTQDIKVYDARVWVPNDKCQWEAGKQYEYIFKITDQANGTTDPDEADPYAPTEPWIDPDDPRIPNDPALIPIVFDGVKVTDYEDAGDVEGNDHIISENTIVNAFHYKYTPAYTYASSSFTVNGLSNTVTIGASISQIYKDLTVWNDLSRFLGGLYYWDGGISIKKIKFGGKEFEWNTTTGLTGSNWYVTGHTADDEYRLLRALTTALTTACSSTGSGYVIMTLVDKDDDERDVTIKLTTTDFAALSTFVAAHSELTTDNAKIQGYLMDLALNSYISTEASSVSATGTLTKTDATISFVAASGKTDAEIKAAMVAIIKGMFTNSIATTVGTCTSSSSDSDIETAFGAVGTYNVEIDDVKYTIAVSQLP